MVKPAPGQRHQGRRHRPSSRAGRHDRLLLTGGFAGGFRSSELAGVAVADVEQMAEGSSGLRRRLARGLVIEDDASLRDLATQVLDDRFDMAARLQHQPRSRRRYLHAMRNLGR